MRVIFSLFGIGFFFFLWVAAISQLVGLPVAWAKVRHTRAWQNRPRGVRRIDLLERFIRPIIWETGWVALVVLALVVSITWVLGVTDTAVGAVAYSLVFLIPAVLAGVAVNRLDPRDFEAVVSEAAPATRAAAPAASGPGSSGPGV
ncbi:MAG TPA: hypothetical protein VGV34_07295 [Solirubrobacterales bacterium]|nr:hypothetical protein [Solirubrobacterales bacterium]